MAESLKNTACREIRRRILEGVLVSGEIIDRRSIAKELGMSAAPVLEAMLLLETEGLLETIPRKGSRVSIHRPEDVRGHYLVREALECQIVRQVFGSPIAENFERLSALALKVDECRRNANLELLESEVAFHTAIADLVGCPVFTKIFTVSLRADMFYKMRYVSNREERSSHIRLLENLRDAPNAEAAEELVRSDLRNGRASMFMNLQTPMREKPIKTS
jgi:DNA-binding GntR family transcriptional regulator